MIFLGGLIVKTIAGLFAKGVTAAAAGHLGASHAVSKISQNAAQIGAEWGAGCLYDKWTSQQDFYVKPKKRLVMLGKFSYRIEDKQSITITVEEIRFQNEGCTGTLKLELWATDFRNFGEYIRGYQIGTLMLDSLSTGQYYNDIRRTISYSPPPGGLYYITMTLNEYKYEGWQICDFFTFNKKTYIGRQLELNGSAKYCLEGNGTVRIQCSKVSNNRRRGNSGSLRLELWATKKKYTGGTINGSRIAFHQLDSLDAGQYYYDINRLLEYSQPTSGWYYITLCLCEYDGYDYPLFDYITFDNQRFLGKELEFMGTTGYSFKKGKLTIRAKKIINHRNGGKSGSLKLSIWAIKEPYSKGSIKGHVLGECQLKELEGGYSYNDIEREVNYSAPPKGEYYTCILLSEFEDSWCIVDGRSFDGTSHL